MDKILIVDDQPFICGLFSKVMASSATVITSASPEDAKNYFHAAPLRLTKQDLLEFLTGLEKWSEEREKTVVNELKNNPELLAQVDKYTEREH